MRHRRRAIWTTSYDGEFSKLGKVIDPAEIGFQFVFAEAREQHYSDVNKIERVIRSTNHLEPDISVGYKTGRADPRSHLGWNTAGNGDALIKRIFPQGDFTPQLANEKCVQRAREAAAARDPRSVPPAVNEFSAQYWVYVRSGGRPDANLAPLEPVC
ncbi:MAG: hypothetical protein M1816_002965 [Peltula sp. TS41687]|nr:MAG: hypothetical protein M1816_002965 [Peltula sp. TS41687]